MFFKPMNLDLNNGGRFQASFIIFHYLSLVLDFNSFWPEVHHASELDHESWLVFCDCLLVFFRFTSTLPLVAQACSSIVIVISNRSSSFDFWYFIYWNFTNLSGTLNLSEMELVLVMDRTISNYCKIWFIDWHWLTIDWLIILLGIWTGMDFGVWKTFWIFEEFDHKKWGGLDPL